MVIVVVVALVLGAGGFWLFTKDSGEAEASGGKEYDAAVEKVGAAEVSWRVAQGPAQEAMGVEDFWVTDELLVRRLLGRVVGYDLKSGDEAWTYETKGPLKDRCRSSQTPSNNRVALLVSNNEAQIDECGKLVVLDIASGAEVFATELAVGDGNPDSKTARPAEGDPAPTNGDVPVVFGERVLIGGEVPRAFDLTSGQPAPVPASYSACAADDLAVLGETLVAEVVCDGEGGKSTRKLAAFDANLGQLWEWATPPDERGEGSAVLGVLSLDPLVVELGHLGHPSQIVRVDVRTGDAAPISAYDAGTSDGEFMTACDDYALGTCHNGRVVDGKLIVTTKPDQINPGDPDAGSIRSTEFRNELVAFDLETGEEAWRTGRTEGRMTSMVRTDSGLAVYQMENANGGKGMVLEVDTAGGTLEPVLPIGPRAGGDDSLMSFRRAFYFGGDNHQAVYREGLFVMFSITHRDDSVGDPDTVAFALE